MSKITQQLSLIKEDSNKLIVKFIDGQLMPSDTRMSRVEARFKSTPMKSQDERIIVIALTKLITDVFDYFNADHNEAIISMLVNDIIDDYGSYSFLEMYKAINEGRKSQGNLYGKFSGLHIQQWLQTYMTKMDDEVVEYQINKKYQREQELNDLHIPEIEDKFNFKKVEEKTKLDVSPAQRLEAYIQVNNLSKEEKDRQEHSRKWNFKKHGSYEEYMRRYDKFKL